MNRLLPDRVGLGQQLCLEPTALSSAASSTQTGSAIGTVCLNPIPAGPGPGYASWCAITAIVACPRNGRGSGAGAAPVGLGLPGTGQDRTQRVPFQCRISVWEAPSPPGTLWAYDPTAQTVPGLALLTPVKTVLP